MSKKYKVGVDLGGTNIAVGVIDENYNIIGRGKLKTNVPRPAEEIMADIVKGVKIAAENAKISLDQIESIGIGTPGSVNKETGYIEYANNLYFNQVPAVKMINELIDAKVFLENDANCAALGEAIAGVGKGKKLFIAVTLGTGVGGGIINDGKVMAGCNEAGGELGHMVIEMNGIPCNCGRTGCWEAYASATALVEQTQKAMLDHKDSKMWALASGSLENVNGRTAFDAMRAGDEWYRHLSRFSYTCQSGESSTMRISWAMMPRSFSTLSAVKYGTETNESRSRRFSSKCSVQSK